MRVFLTLCLSFFFIVSSGCQAYDKSPSSQPAPIELKEQKMLSKHSIEVTGTIYFKALEGGFYALISDDGQKFTLAGVDKNKLGHELRVKVRGKILDVVTIQQYGKVLQVESFQTLNSPVHKDH